MDFDTYVENRGTQLGRMAWLLTGDRHAAEDLLQSALLDAFRQWRKVEAAGNPDGYLRRLMFNRHLTGIRRKWRGEVATDFVCDGAEQRALSAVPDVGEQVARATSLRDALSALSPRTRTILVLRYFEDRPFDEIAQLLDTSAANVRSAASRGVAALRSTLVTSDWTDMNDNLGQDDPDRTGPDSNPDWASDSDVEEALRLGLRDEADRGTSRSPRRPRFVRSRIDGATAGPRWDPWPRQNSWCSPSPSLNDRQRRPRRLWQETRAA